MTQRNEILEEIEAILPSEMKTISDVEDIYKLIAKCYELENTTSNLEEYDYLEKAISRYQDALKDLMYAKEYVKKELKKCKLVQIKDKLIAINLSGVKIRELETTDIIQLWDEKARVYRLYVIVCKLFDDRVEYNLESVFSKKAKRIEKNTIYRIKV